MSLSIVLGIDVAKQKFDAALLVDGKTKHKTCKNSAEGFEALTLWLEKQGLKRSMPAWKRPAATERI